MRNGHQLHRNLDRCPSFLAIYAENPLQSIDDAVRKRGDVVMYYAVRKCTCAAAVPITAEASREYGTLVEDSLRANPTCTICQGIGYWWKDPIKLKAIVVEVNVKNSKELMVAGIAGPGDLVLMTGTLSMRRLQFNDYDKIVFKHAGGQPHDGDVIKRAKTVPYQFTDRVIHPIAKIESVTWHDPFTAVPVIIECEPNVDFTWTEGSREIVWNQNSAKLPPVGMAYTVMYRAYFEWLALVSPMQRIESANIVGQRIVLRKKNLVGQVGDV